MKLVIDFDTLPCNHRDNLLRMIKTYAIDSRRDMERDLKDYTGGDAKKDMMAWCEAFREISDDAASIYKAYNFPTPK